MMLLKSVLIALVLLLLISSTVYAAEPTVTITVSAQVISITNTQSTWNIGAIEINDIVYFSATGERDDDYSLITNTGNVAVNIEIRGTDIEGGVYDWTLSASPGNQICSIYADADEAGAYSIEVKTSSYNNIKTNLAPSGTCKWSMKFTAPTVFHASDNGSNKSSTITLVASGS